MEVEIRVEVGDGDVSKARAVLMSGPDADIRAEDHAAYERYVAELGRTGTYQEQLARLNAQQFVWQQAVESLCAMARPRQAAGAEADQPASKKAKAVRRAAAAPY